MTAKRLHPVISLVVLATYLLNMAAVACGTVLCDDPVGDALGGGSIGLTLEHGHCGESEDHDHSESDHPCWCSSCPCEDTPVSMDLGALPRYDEVLASLSDLSLTDVSWACVMPPHCGAALLQGDPRAESLDRHFCAIRSTLRQHTTIVLII